MFSPYDFKKNDNIILSYFKDNKISKTNLIDQTKMKPNKVTDIEDYFY